MFSEDTDEREDMEPEAEVLDEEDGVTDQHTEPTTTGQPVANDNFHEQQPQTDNLSPILPLQTREVISSRDESTTSELGNLLDFQEQDERVYVS